MGSGWRFDTEEKMNILCSLLGKNLVFCVCRRLLKLGCPYSVIQNDRLSIVVGGTNYRGEVGLQQTFSRGIDLVFHHPFLEIDVRSEEFIVGGMVAPPSEKLSQQICFTPAPVQQPSEIRLLDITLRIGKRFQHGNSVYKIKELQGNMVLAICIFGASKGNREQFTKEDVSRAVLRNLS
jgi:hypothetical protein